MLENSAFGKPRNVGGNFEKPKPNRKVSNLDITTKINQTKAMTKILKLVLFFTITIITFSCGNQADKIKPGSICTIEDGEGKFGVVKVLVINEQEAHVKIFKNKYDQRPVKLDIKILSLGSLNDKDGGFGIGHVPLERKGFDSWKPVSVGFEEVTEDDLIGYEIWKNQ